MIAVDTNVLLRYLLDDDPLQSKKAALLIAGDNQVLVTDVVLVETVWTLRGKRYNLNKEAIIRVINLLFEEPNVTFEDGQSVWRALGDYKCAKPVKVGGKKKEADFPDALIINKARFSAASKSSEFLGMYTFDVAAQEIIGAKKP